MAFDKIPKINYQPIQQTPIDYPVVSNVSGVSTTPESDKSLATQIVDNYTDTLKLFDWLIGQFDDKIKDVVVHVDPDQHPEVWMAMKRIFKDTANQNLNGRSYLTVVDALEEISNIEYQEVTSDIQAPELDFINSISDTPETIVNPVPYSGSAEDLAAIADATESRTKVFAKTPPKPKVNSIPHFNSGNIRHQEISTNELYQSALSRLRYENGRNGHVEYIGGVKYLVWEV